MRGYPEVSMRHLEKTFVFVLRLARSLFLSHRARALVSLSLFLLHTHTYKYTHTNTNTNTNTNKQQERQTLSEAIRRVI